jgi:hypothetical protein
MNLMLHKNSFAIVVIALLLKGCSIVQTVLPSDTPTAPPQVTIAGQGAPSNTTTVTPRQLPATATSPPEPTRVNFYNLPPGIYFLVPSVNLPSHEASVTIQVVSQSGVVLGDLFTLDSDGIREIAVSRDLSRFAYVKAQPSGIYSYTTLWLGDLSSGEATMVRNSNHCYDLSWAPEGDALLLVCPIVGGAGDNDLALVRQGSDTVERFEAWDHPGPFYFNPGFSPDGSWISYTWSSAGQDRDPRSGIYFASSECLEYVRSCPSKMTGPLSTYYSIALWSPDSSQILYADDPDIRVFSVSSGFTGTYHSSGSTMPIAWLPNRDPLVRIETSVNGALFSDVFSLDLTSGEFYPINSECVACQAIQWFQVP